LDPIKPGTASTLPLAKLDPLFYQKDLSMFQQLLFAILLPALALSHPGKRKEADVNTSTTPSLPTAIPEPVLSEPVAKKPKVEEEFDDSAPAPVLIAPKPRGYVSKEEKDAAFQSLFFSDSIMPEAERKEVDRRLTEYFDDEDERKHREAGLPGLPWTSKSLSGYTNSQEAHAASQSINTWGNTLTRKESDDIARRVDRFRQEQRISQREVDELRGSDIVINLEALPANIRIVYERFMTPPVDGEDAYNSFVEFFELQRNGNAPWGSSMMDDFMIAVEQYRSRAYLVPDTATNAMNLVLFNLEVAQRLGLEYVNPGDRLFLNGFKMYGREFTSPDERAALLRSRVGPSRTISDAIAALAINDTVEVTVDVVEDAFERNAAIMFAEGERYVGATHDSITALKNLRQARSLLLRSFME
jgi:hypothetical protein